MTVATALLAVIAILAPSLILRWRTMRELKQARERMRRVHALIAAGLIPLNERRRLLGLDESPPSDKLRTPTWMN